MQKVGKEWDDFGKSISTQEEQIDFDADAEVTQLNSAAFGKTEQVATEPAVETVESAPVERISLGRCIAYSTLATFSIAGIIAALFYKPGKAQEKKAISEDNEAVPMKKKEIKKTLKTIMKENNVKVNLMWELR